MFKPSVKDKQLDMFSNIRNMFRGVSSKQFEDDKSWHNQFRRNVVNQIDEAIFKPLYDSRSGAPNASIRVMVGMMLLKEGLHPALQPCRGKPGDTTWNLTNKTT